MALHEGIVETVIKNKGGFYAIKLPDAWYGTGEKSDPGLRQGDMIKFEYAMNGAFRNIVKNTLTKLPNDAPKAGNAQPKSNWVPDADRQKSIIFQSSRKDAIEVAKLALAQGAVSLPAKKADQMGALMALIDEITARYVDTATNCDALISTYNNTNEVEGEKFDG